MNEINIIHEIDNKNNNKKSKLIPIPNSNSNSNSKSIAQKQLNYELQNNFFDPNSSSPPNYFISKLLTRIKNYDADKKVINLYKE